VLLLDPFAGLLFLVLAVLIALRRVVIGEHYPGDVPIRYSGCGTAYSAAVMPAIW
jgi:hypothetical protein